MLKDPRYLFGLRLSEMRKSRGWSQERLAAESGLARSYVGGVERGQRNIALLNICKLARALDTVPGTLLLTSSGTETEAVRDLGKKAA